jgi:hypothetical protein
LSFIWNLMIFTVQKLSCYHSRDPYCDIFLPFGIQFLSFCHHVIFWSSYLKGEIWGVKQVIRSLSNSFNTHLGYFWRLMSDWYFIIYYVLHWLIHKYCMKQYIINNILFLHKWLDQPTLVQWEQHYLNEFSRPSLAETVLWDLPCLPSNFKCLYF